VHERGHDHDQEQHKPRDEDRRTAAYPAVESAHPRLVLVHCHAATSVVQLPALYEHPFVTSRGSALGRFQRACDHGNVTMAEIAALELPKPVALVNALRLVRLYATAESPKFERAALRWLGRLVTEYPITLDEARVACAWLSALPGPEGDLAATSLSGLAYRR
jgi:hypothetical protein